MVVRVAHPDVTRAAAGLAQRTGGTCLSARPCRRLAQPGSCLLSASQAGCTLGSWHHKLLLISLGMSRAPAAQVQAPGQAHRQTWSTAQGRTATSSAIGAPYPYNEDCDATNPTNDAMSLTLSSADEDARADRNKLDIAAKSSGSNGPYWSARARMACPLA